MNEIFTETIIIDITFVLRNKTRLLRINLIYRYNLRSLERWVLDRRLAPLLPLLNPIIQAVQFLQMQPISLNDVMFIHKKYDQISCNQMLKIVELYNNYCSSEMPTSYDRVSVSPGVIDKLKQKIRIHGNLDDTVSFFLQLL